MDKNGKNNISLRFDQVFFDKLHLEAKKRGQTLSAYIKNVLYEEINKDK